MDIDGLNINFDYIDDKIEAYLISKIQEESWNTELKRRTQHYGIKYDYKTRNLVGLHKIKALPDWIKSICDRLVEDKKMSMPEQVIINEYKPGQGIASHIDSPVFGEIIISLSLGSDCLMNFTRDTKIIPVRLRKKSLVSISGDARYNYQHGIRSVMKDTFEDGINKRGTRYSITFRTIAKPSN